MAAAYTARMDRATLPTNTSSTAMNVIVIDDDAINRRMLADAVRATGATVSEADNSEAMLMRLPTEQFAVIVMDVNLPGKDGMTAAAEARRQSDAGIILVSVIRDARSRSQAIGMGADDFLVKPVDRQELAARVQRLGTRVLASRAASPQRVALGNGVQLDVHRQQLLAASGNAQALTHGETRLAQALSRRSVCTREQLAVSLHDNVADTDDPGNLRTVDTLIARLRKKLAAAGAPPDVLRTVRGVGYALVAAEPRSKAT